MLAVWTTTEFELGPFLQVLFVLLFVGVAWGGYQLRLLGVRAASSEAKQLLAHDPRPLVLYLRSFEDDESSQEAVELPIFGFLLGRRDEDRLMRTLSQCGPVIAVGRPGEWLPPAGAARLSVAVPDWRAEVERLCQQAHIVVLRVGFTDGFWWEVRHVWERVPRERILLWLPPTKRGILNTLKRNREFAERFQTACDVDLDLGGCHRFIYFTSKGVPISPPVSPPASAFALRDVFNFINIDREIAQQLEPFARSLGISLRIPTTVSAVRIIVLLIMAPAVVVIGCMTLWFAITTLGHVAHLWRR
jgi:hypothetical protein